MNHRAVIRPLEENDLDDFIELAESAGGGLTNLPRDPDFLRGRLDESLRAFDPRVRRAGDHRYLFALEDVEQHKLAGVSGIISKIGGFQPWYSYEIRRERFVFEPLRIDHEIEVLYPEADYNGPSELFSLFLRPEYRKGGLGRLLSLSRFHFMAELSRRFDREVIAELRGVTDDEGRSPFWEAVGRHFFQIDFRQADFLSGLEDKEFIA
jgi:arginine N-succinyltransferase